MSDDGQGEQPSQSAGTGKTAEPQEEQAPPSAKAIDAQPSTEPEPQEPGADAEQPPARAGLGDSSQPTPPAAEATGPADLTEAAPSSAEAVESSDQAPSPVEAADAPETTTANSTGEDVEQPTAADAQSPSATGRDQVPVADDQSAVGDEHHGQLNDQPGEVADGSGGEPAESEGEPAEPATESGVESVETVAESGVEPAGTAPEPGVEQLPVEENPEAGQETPSSLDQIEPEADEPSRDSPEVADREENEDGADAPTEQDQQTDAPVEGDQQVDAEQSQEADALTQGQDQESLAEQDGKADSLAEADPAAEAKSTDRPGNVELDEAPSPIRPVGGPVARPPGAADQLDAQRGWREGDPPPPPRDGNDLPTGEELHAKFAGENDPNNDARFFYPDTVHYMAPAEGEKCRLFVDGDGKLRNAGVGRDNSQSVCALFDTSGSNTHWSGGGRAIFVMDGHGNLYATSHEVGNTHHSSMLAGAPVAGAGEIEVHNGELMVMTDRSGHYEPAAVANDRALSGLRAQGLRTSSDFKQLDWDENER